MTAMRISRFVRFRRRRRSGQAAPPQEPARESLKAEIDALLRIPFQTLVLPPHLLALYNDRSRKGNIFMIAAWCRWVGLLNLPLAGFDVFFCGRALIPYMVMARVFITSTMLFFAFAMRRNWLRGHEDSTVTASCLGLMILGGMFGLRIHRNEVLFSFLIDAIVIVYTAILLLRVDFAKSCRLAGYSLALMALFLAASGGSALAEKLEIITLYTGAMAAIINARRIQTLYRQRMFLLHMREEMRNSEVTDLNTLLSNIAYTDPLTGIRTRRYFDDICNGMTSETANVFPLSLCMIDVDYFKQLNDKLGHLEGDRCLKLIAAAIQGRLRAKADIGVRYGGDEFVILLPGTEAAAALEIAERIRNSVLALALPNPNSPLKIVTTTIGAATIIGPPLVIPSLIEAADSALYKAKAAGRNQVACTVISH